MDNEERIELAEHAIGAFCEAGDYLDGCCVDDEIITDLLTNLRHYCQANEIDFGKCCQMSEIHFEEEDGPR